MGLIHSTSIEALFERLTQSAGSCGRTASFTLPWLNHIAKDELELYCLNRLSGQRVMKIQAHILSCGRCQVRVMDELDVLEDIRYALKVMPPNRFANELEAQDLKCRRRSHHRLAYRHTVIGGSRRRWARHARGPGVAAVVPGVARPSAFPPDLTEAHCKP